jgi:inner membrane protein
MLLFAHVGLTFGAAAAAAAGIAENRRLTPVASWPAALSRYLDIRWLMVGSLLPDIIDKPLGQYILPGLIGTGRAYAHTLLFLIVLSAAALIVRWRSGRAWLLALAIGTFAHLVLDQLWTTPQVLFWPLLGAGFAHIDLEAWAGTLWQALVSEPSVYVPEIIGFVILAWFGLALLRRKRVRAFLARGKVV